MGRVPRPSSEKDKEEFKFVAKPMENSPEDWLVEATNYDFPCTYITVFIGRDAAQRAVEYAKYKNEQLGLK